MSSNGVRTLVVAFAIVTLLTPTAVFAGTDQECFNAEITNAFWDISSSVSTKNRTVTHTNQPEDSDTGKLLNLWETETEISRGTDHDLKIDDNSKGLLTDTDWLRNSSQCATLTVTPLSASVTFPAIYGVCGPSASLTASLTFYGVLRTNSSGITVTMPKLLVTPEVAATLSCGVGCLAEVYGGIWGQFQFRINPYASSPGNALERTVKVWAGPEAGANLACIGVWGWRETLYTSEWTLDIDWV
jgi:hypothetical protein